MGNRVISNQRVTVLIGPATAIADYTAPKLSEVESLLNVSEAINWNSFDFNIQASNLEDDRSLTDAAGAKSRQYTQFGGTIPFFTPKPGDTTSIYYQAREVVKTERTLLAVVIRTITLNSVGVAAGDELNAYRVMNDAVSDVRGKVSQYFTVKFTPQDLCGVNAIVAPAAAVAPIVTVADGSLTGAAGSIARLKAVYQSVPVTIGATWVSSDPTVATVTQHGIVMIADDAVSAATCSITCTYPGSLPSTEQTVTVS